MVHSEQNQNNLLKTSKKWKDSFASSVFNQSHCRGLTGEEGEKQARGRWEEDVGWVTVEGNKETPPHPETAAAQVCADRTTDSGETDGMWSRLPVAHELSPG